MTIDIKYTQIWLASQRLSSVDYYKVTEISYQYENYSLSKQRTSKDISSVYIFLPVTGLLRVYYKRLVLLRTSYKIPPFQKQN